MPTAEQVTEERLFAFRDLARSGITEMTGQAIRSEGYGAGEFIGRHKGLKTAFPKDFNRVPDSPKQIAAAIDRGSGKVYDRVYAAVLKEAEREGFKPARKRSPGRPTVPPHAGRPYCAHCKVMHAKGQHRFHGAGSYHKTHLFSFGPNPGVPMMTTAGAKRVFSALMQRARERTLTVREKEALAIARQTLRARAKSATNPKRRKGEPTKGEMRKIRRRMRRGKIVTLRPRSNPQGTVIYGQVLEIVCRRTGPHRCDAACKRVNHTYRHVFKSRPAIRGLNDGRLMIG